MFNSFLKRLMHKCHLTKSNLPTTESLSFLPNIRHSFIRNFIQILHTETILEMEIVSSPIQTLSVLDQGIEQIFKTNDYCPRFCPNISQDDGSVVFLDTDNDTVNN